MLIRRIPAANFRRRDVDGRKLARREVIGVLVGSGQGLPARVERRGRIDGLGGGIAVDAERRTRHAIQIVALEIVCGAEELGRADLAGVDLILLERVEFTQGVGHAGFDRRPHLGCQLVGVEAAVLVSAVRWSTWASS